MNKAYEYAKKSIHSKECPKYVKKQCREFIRIADGKDEKYYLNEDKVKQIENVLNTLTSMLSAAEEEQKQIKNKLDELILKATL